MAFIGLTPSSIQSFYNTLDSLNITPTVYSFTLPSTMSSAADYSPLTKLRLLDRIRIPTFNQQVLNSTTTTSSAQQADSTTLSLSGKLISFKSRTFPNKTDPSQPWVFWSGTLAVDEETYLQVVEAGVAYGVTADSKFNATFTNTKEFMGQEQTNYYVSFDISGAERRKQQAIAQYSHLADQKSEVAAVFVGTPSSFKGRDGEQVKKFTLTLVAGSLDVTNGQKPEDEPEAVVMPAKKAKKAPAAAAAPAAKKAKASLPVAAPAKRVVKRSLIIDSEAETEEEE